MEQNNLSQYWAEFCDSIKQAGEEILAPGDSLDEVNQAEGLRYLTRLLKGSFEKFIEFSDPNDPHIFKMCDERSGYGGDNPDNIYSASPVLPGEVYEITGNRGTVWQISFNIFKFGQDSQYELLGRLDETQLVTDQDGDFVVTLGGVKKENNWLALPDGANQVMVRQTFRDRSKELEATLNITKRSSSSTISPLNLGSMLKKLEGSKGFFTKTGLTVAGWSKEFSRFENVLPLTDPEFIAAGGGDPTAFFYMAGWALKPGQALLVHLQDFPPEKLWNIALFNYWFESLDYVNFRIHTNSAICKKNDDGSVTLVICNEDPGVDNWLNGTGHSQGQMMLRAWTGGIMPAEPKTELVEIGSVDWASKFKRWP